MIYQAAGAERMQAVANRLDDQLGQVEEQGRRRPGRLRPPHTSNGHKRFNDRLEHLRGTALGFRSYPK
jgi:hypothetical protein